MKFLQALALLLCISPFSSPQAQDYGDKDAPECRHVECVVVESRGRGILIPSDDRLRREFEARLEAERRNPYGPRPAPPSANYYGTAPPPDPYAQPYSPPTRPVYGPPNPKVQPVHPKATSASEAITQYGHDALGRNTLIDDSEYGATVIDYWPDGRIRSIERSGGVVSEYTYDLAGRAETITHTRGAEVIARVAYDYDANGNRIAERLSQGGAERITTYEYDRDDRLIAVNTPDGRDEYTLDPVGNRIGEKSWAGDELINDITQAFDARDRIQSRTDAISGLSTSYQHDANGNLTGETVSGPGITTTTTTYVYDPENRLLEVRKPSGNVQYTFDAEGKRIASSASGRARYDAGSLYAELNGANQVIRRHHTSAPNRAASRGWMQRAAATLTLFLGFSDPGGATTQHFHHLHDALNTPIATTSADGNIAQRNLYDAFGNLEEQTSPNPYLAERPSRIGFTGYQLDRETSSEPEADGGISQTSYHAKARQYHAGRGSFMQQDPWAGEHTNPASLHRYLYAYSNPGMFVDPDGRVSFLSDGDAGIAALVNRYDQDIESAIAAGSPGRAFMLGLGRGLASVGGSVIGGLNTTSNLLASNLYDGPTYEQAQRELDGNVLSMADSMVTGHQTYQIVKSDPGAAASAAGGSLVTYAVDLAMAEPRAMASLGQFTGQLLVPAGGAKVVRAGSESVGTVRTAMRMDGSFIDSDVVRDLDYPPARDSGPAGLTGQTVGADIYADPAAELAYARIRSAHFDDIHRITESTGLTYDEAISLKKHLFFGRHRLFTNSEDSILERFEADREIAFAWERAQSSDLTVEGRAWFRQLADHELGERALMAQGIPYRNPASWDAGAFDGIGRFTASPPGAHDLAPPQPTYGSFPGFTEW